MGRLIAVAAVLAAVLLVSPSVALAVAGDLDQTFDGDGRVTTELGSTDGALAVAVQPDGKIVVLAFSGESANLRDFALVRYASDGMLDPTFDGDGIRWLDGLSAEDLAIQADGKIVVATTELGLARFNEDGSVDMSFGDAGVASTDCFCDGHALALQADGKIVVAGRTELESEFGDAIVARFNDDGTLDSSFGGGRDWDMPAGVQLLRMEDQSTSSAVATKRNGKIVIAGVSLRGGHSYHFALARLTSDGRLDRSFSGNGIARAKFSENTGSWANDVALQSDGKIVECGLGFRRRHRPSNFAVARYTRSGTLDQTFSGDGRKETDFSGGIDEANSCLVEGDGRIVVVGSSKPARHHEATVFALARYRLDGSLDRTFSANGKKRTRFGPHPEDTADGVGLQLDGRIVVAGSVTLVPDAFDVGLARYLTG